MSVNPVVWNEWARYCDELREEAKHMSKKELKEKLASYQPIETEKQKKKFIRKLFWKNKKKLTDLWIEEEYYRIHPHGI